MIIDKIENFGRYQSINSRFKLAQHFLESTNFTSLSLGRHEIFGDEIYAMVFEYDTKDAELNKLEAHKRYIDIQYVAKGEENVGVSILDKQKVSQKYDESNDYHLYIDNDMSQIELKSGMFAIFFPDDLHLPGLKSNTEQLVKKIVVKVKI